MIYKAASGKLIGPIVTALSGSAPSRQLLLHRTFVLVFSFIIYATYRLSRRPLSIAKSIFHNEKCETYGHNETVHWENIGLHSNETHGNGTAQSCGWSPFDGANGKELLGLLDTCFLFMYMFGTYGNGYVADRVDVRYFLSVSLTTCGVACIAFGLARTFHIHSLWYFLVIQAVAGYASASMPALISVVGQWFGTVKKGFIFGIWNWHGSVGTILGSVLAGAFIETNWSLSFIVPGLICIVMAVLVLVLLIPKPSNVGLDLNPRSDIEKIVNIQQRRACKSITNDDDEKAISFWNAIIIPGVIEFAIAQFFIKLVTYTFLYWLPLFLKETSKISPSKSAYASILFDVGGCVGSMVIGLIADFTGMSAITCIVFLVLSIPSLYSFYIFSASLLLSQILQFITGLLLNGPFCLIMSTVSTNLACKAPTKSAMATVSGIVNGTGSLGACVGPLLAGIVSKNGNWKHVFYMAIGSIICATVSLLRIGYQEFRSKRYIVQQ